MANNYRCASQGRIESNNAFQQMYLSADTELQVAQVRWAAAAKPVEEGYRSLRLECCKPDPHMHSANPEAHMEVPEDRQSSDENT